MKKEIVKHIAMGVLTIVGIACFLALTGEQEGTLTVKILSKVALAICLAVIILIGKVLRDHDYLPEMEDE